MPGIDQILEAIIALFIVAVFLAIAPAFFKISELSGTVLIISLLVVAVGIIASLFGGRGR